MRAYCGYTCFECSAPWQPLQQLLTEGHQRAEPLGQRLIDDSNEALELRADTFRAAE